MRKPVKRVFGAAALIALIVLAAVSLRPQPVPVDTAVITTGRFEQTIDEDGRTQVRERYLISAPLSGRVLRIRLKEGDAVDRGGLLAVMLPAAPALLDLRTERELRERLGAAEADRLRTKAVVERAKAALKQARADLGRARQLAAEGLMPPAQLEQNELEAALRDKELEAAEFENDVAGHQEDLARAALLQARKGMEPGASPDRLVIRSPVAGRVLRVLQESEGMAATGAPLLEMGDPSDLEVVAELLTTDAVLIRPGMSARIERFGGEAPLEGRVRRIEPAAFTKVSALGVEEQRVNVILDLVSPPEQWRMLGDGYRVEVRIGVYHEESAVKVPTGALFREGDRWAAFVVSGGRAARRAVEVGRRSGEEAVVLEGLAPGERVIVYPADTVSDGVRVKPRSG